jgi:hypothetical protein
MGDPLEERPTGTSVTPQANPPNYMGRRSYRKLVDSHKRGFRSPLGRSSGSNARRGQAREIGSCRSSGIDVAVRR